MVFGLKKTCFFFVFFKRGFLQTLPNYIIETCIVDIRFRKILIHTVFRRLMTVYTLYHSTFPAGTIWSTIQIVNYCFIDKTWELNHVRISLCSELNMVIVLAVRCHNVKNGKETCEVTEGKSSRMRSGK